MLVPRNASFRPARVLVLVQFRVLVLVLVRVLVQLRLRVQERVSPPDPHVVPGFLLSLRLLLFAFLSSFPVLQRHRRGGMPSCVISHQVVVGGGGCGCGRWSSFSFSFSP